MWIYYYCNHGPGHQSRNDGFVHFEKNVDVEDIKSYLFNIIDYENANISFWTVSKPPQSHIDSSIKEVQRQIANLEKRVLSLLNGAFHPKIVKRADETIIRNLKNKYEKDVLHRLHRAGFMYGYNDIAQWRRGQRSPSEPDRQKILRIIRRAKSYKTVIG